VNINFARFDVKALYAALDPERGARGRSWAQLQAEIGVSSTAMRRMANGGRMELDGVMFILQWLGRPAEDFLSSAGLPPVPMKHGSPNSTASSKTRPLRVATSA
jgi:hypothetical protein